MRRAWLLFALALALAQGGCGLFRPRPCAERAAEYLAQLDEAMACWIVAAAEAEAPKRSWRASGSG